MKTAVITGCNKGLGLKLLERFSKEGYNIIALNRKQYDDFDVKCDEIQKEFKNTITAFYADFTESNTLKNAVQQITDLEVSIDVLINNAGMNVVNTLFTTEYKDLDTSFRINYFAPVVITKGIASLMIREGKGVIVNISSTAGLHPEPGLSCYGASKAAICYFTQSVAQELAPFGVRINAVACGPMTSTMYESMDDKAKKKIYKRVALGRISELDEIADAVLYLASEKSSFITGSVLPIDGGYK